MPSSAGSLRGRLGTRVIRGLPQCGGSPGVGCLTFLSVRRRRDDHLAKTRRREDAKAGGEEEERREQMPSYPVAVRRGAMARIDTAFRLSAWPALERPRPRGHGRGGVRPWGRGRSSSALRWVCMGYLTIPTGTIWTPSRQRRLSNLGVFASWRERDNPAVPGPAGQESAIGSPVRAEQRRRNRDGWPAGQLDRGPLESRASRPDVPIGSAAGG